jgi:hypothetical protein
MLLNFCIIEKNILCLSSNSNALEKSIMSPFNTKVHSLLAYLFKSLNKLGKFLFACLSPIWVSLITNHIPESSQIFHHLNNIILNLRVY